jgi:hypothetical protein
MADNYNNDDNVQHGIDDNPTGDAEKGATLGGVGGAVTGAVAGAMAGPVGAVAGAIIGGLAGAVASGAAVGAIDRHDNDNTVSGLGSGATRDIDESLDDNTVYDHTYVRDANGNLVRDVNGNYTRDYNAAPVVGNGVPGIQTGGRDIDGTPDTRGILEKTADAVTGDNYDDKTGKPVSNDYDSNAGMNRMQSLGETTPSIKTGGYANDGTPDTRGVGEKVADAVTGDVVDDKTGRVVNHP